MMVILLEIVLVRMPTIIENRKIIKKLIFLWLLEAVKDYYESKPLPVIFTPY